MESKTFPHSHPGYRALFDVIMSSRCWDCDKEKALGKCPDCDDPGELCAACLKDHQALEHGAVFEQGGK